MNGCMASSGSLIVWFRDQFARGASFGSLDAEAAPLPPGADGLLVLPYFLGEKTPLFDPFARGTVVGLTLSHTRGHLFRAILEGISFGFRHHVEVLAESGATPTRVLCTNGGADSKLWRQVTADVLGLPLERVAGHPGSALGAAFAAGKGVNIFTDWDQVAAFIRLGRTVEPEPTAQARYNEFYPLYRETYAQLKDLYPRLARASAADPA
ncbi:MAG TPA: FGGY-family carbohydrate kinase, partial [Candidatus Limnocylindrales bacterium]|nr:FGGY-family carbohydrate kinase [Candidatus Limnocylindrales bacterium]